MKKFLAALILSFYVCSPALAANYYFSTSGDNSTGAGTLGSPWHHVNGKKSAAAALSCGDTVNLKRGDTWTGSEAEVIISSGTTSCSDVNPITVQGYGTGANPILAGADVSTGFSQVGVTTTWTKASQSQTHLKTVTQDDNKALFWWSGTNTTLPAGTFRREGTTLYVHCYSDANPNSSSIRIASYAHTEDADGGRGLLSGGKRTSGKTYGNYIHFRDITILGPNGVGISSSGQHWWDAGIQVIGAGMDGWLAYSDLSTSLEDGAYYRSYGTTVTYSAAGANGGGGAGQGVTSYASFGVWNHMLSHDNAMAGFDLLNFGPSTSVTQCMLLWDTGYRNGLARSDPSYDPNFYNDGGYNNFIYGNKFYLSGVGSGTAANARSSVGIGSEHPVTDPVSDIYFINNLIYSSHWEGLQTDNANSSTANIKNITMAYNTICAYDAGTFDMPFHLGDIDTTADNYKVRNNIFVEDSIRTDEFITVGDYLDSDNNLYYKRATASSSTPIYKDGGGTTYSLTAWRTASGEDASSVYGDPLLTLDTDASTDPTLGGGSPAIGLGMTSAYTVPAWLPTALKTYLGTAGIRGSTIASGAEDNYGVAPDAGFHTDYADLTSTSVAPASLVQSVVGNAVVSFTIPDPMSWIPYNGVVKITFPSGFGLSSGGTTAVSGLVGISGTVTSGVAGQVLTVTRVGDGNSEFPGTFGFTASNISNPASTGVTGAFLIQVYDASGNLLSRDTAVSAVNIITAGSVQHFSGSGISGSGLNIT